MITPEEIKEVIAKLANAPSCTLSRTVLLRKIYPKVDAMHLDFILEELKSRDLLEAFRNEEKRISYRLTGQAIFSLRKLGVIHETN